MLFALAKYVEVVMGHDDTETQYLEDYIGPC